MRRSRQREVLLPVLRFSVVIPGQAASGCGVTGGREGGVEGELDGEWDVISAEGVLMSLSDCRHQFGGSKDKVNDRALGVRVDLAKHPLG